MFPPEIQRKINDSYEIENNVLNAVPQPMVSIRTSAYNHGKYIRQCIEGILMQKTDFAFEYIIGEDFSTDDTREIVMEYAAKYPDIIRVVTADYNVGMKANGERCIMRCRGKYMALCEGDDYWTDPYKLQKQVSYMEEHPECALVYTKARTVRLDSATTIIGEPIDPEYGLLVKNVIPTLTTCIRRDVIEEYTATAELSGKIWPAGDYPQWLWIAQKYEIHFIDEVTSAYRVLTESASHSKDINKHVNFQNGVYDIQSYFIKNFYGGNSKLLKKADRRRCWVLFRTYIVYGKNREAFGLFAKNIFKLSAKNIATALAVFVSPMVRAKVTARWKLYY